MPEVEQQVLRVRVHPLSNPRSNRAFAHLLEHLNAAEFTYPGTSLRLVYTSPAKLCLRTRLHVKIPQIRRSEPKCRRHRQSDGQGDLDRQRPRLGRGQEDHREETPYRGGHLRVSAGGSGYGGLGRRRHDGPQVLAKLTTEHLSRLEVIWGDGKYRNNHLDRLHPPHRPDPDPSETDFRVPISHPSTSGGRVAIQCSQ